MMSSLPSPSGDFFQDIRRFLSWLFHCVSGSGQGRLSDLMDKMRKEMKK